MAFGFFNGKKATRDVKQALNDRANKISGRLDFLQGAVSWAALVAGADGSISPEEKSTLTKRIKNNKTFSDNFTGGQIDSAISHAFELLDQGRSGRSSLWKEVEDLKGDSDADMCAMIALDVADEGGIDEKEENVLRDGCRRLGLDYDRLLAA